MSWIIVNQSTTKPLTDKLYENEMSAIVELRRLGETFQSMYVVVPNYYNPLWRKILFEGFKAGDMSGILLPQLSIDVYVPSNTDTDNIVVGFLIKGVPEAVFPFKNFCNYSHGVKQVDYGDSDILPNTSIVYVEYDRKDFKINDLIELVSQASRLADIKPEDFSINFPNSNKSFPYSEEVIEKYFTGRDADKNRLSQYKAHQEQTKKIQQELEDELDFGSIGQRLGTDTGTDTIENEPKNQFKRNPNWHGFRRLQHPVRPAGSKRTKKPTTEPDIPETIQATIAADARRNRNNHVFQWKDFDIRWSQRLHVSPTKITSIRKRIYDST